ncbi:nucleotidyltransferase [Caballeronia sp. 15715]|uniref:nucleotidyltransferase domain-containing protein n=1 Tax=unclassified Caballeronia TaxID=2646786 RepID=UPI0039E6B614
MAIPEDQLTQWAQIGAQVTSKDTYATIKLALESADAGYANKNYKIFLQGSYRNDTNIFKESDVDVVIMLESVFYYDLTPLPEPQKVAFSAAHPDALYTAEAFRAHVLDVLKKRFGDDAVPGSKAVEIQPRHSRRKADVLIAVEHKKYRRFTAVGNEEQVAGICFFKSDGTKVVNYPRLHRKNLTAKNQETNQWMKHIIRIFKNARQRMIEQRVLEHGQAPSYYLEGLLYNVPVDRFGNTYDDSVVRCINWLVEANRATFLCANRQYRLLDDSPEVSWNSKDCNAFLNGFVQLWKGW